MKIGISGAGIAGPTLAYWLMRTGYEPTLIEQAPEPRSGGYVIDFWGVGYEVAERMGIIDKVRARGYQVEDVCLMRPDGSVGGHFGAGVFHELTDGKFTTLPRGDLAACLFESVQGRVETLFGRSISRVSTCNDGLDVTLDDGTERSFDLLVGADGLHSNVRSLVWGRQADFERRLDYYVAAFECRGYPHRSTNAYVSCARPGRSISRFSMRDDRTLFLFVLSADRLAMAEPHDDVARRAALHQVFSDFGWEAPEILAAAEDIPDIYFDRVSQTVVPDWSRGRTVLLGDAAACASLLAGEGTGLAMTEAYMLAGELARAKGDVDTALRLFEARLRPFIEDKQKSARAFASSFAPDTSFGIFVRNTATRLMGFRPLAKLLLGNSVTDAFDLPDYRI